MSSASGDPWPPDELMLEVDDGPSLPKLELRRSKFGIADEKALWALDPNSGHMELPAEAAEDTIESKVGESPIPSSLSCKPPKPFVTFELNPEKL